MINSLKNKILVSFISFSLLLLLIVLSINNHYYRKREEKNQLLNRFVQLETELINVFNNSNAFFSSEITNPDFFVTGNSAYLARVDSLLNSILIELKELRRNSLEQKININDETEAILAYIIEYKIEFSQMVELIKQRGYKDWGTEGEMRSEIHKLENLEKISQVDVLMLRRHEKDYIIRHEDQQITKLYNLAEAFKRAISASTSIDKVQKDSVIRILDKYKLLFSEIVKLDQQMGLKDNSAKKKDLDGLAILLENQINKLTDKVILEKQNILNQARITYIFEIILAVLLSGLVSLLITQQVTKSLRGLTQHISNLTRNEIVYAPFIPTQKTEEEIMMIFREFNNLIEHLEKKESQRDMALNDLKRQEIRYRQMADMLPVCIFETDANGKFEYINKKFRETFEYTEEDLKKIELKDLFVQKNSDDNSLIKIGIDPFETKAVRKSGGNIPVIVYLSERSEAKEKLEVRGVIVDIVDRVKSIEELQKAKLKAEESDRLKTAFLANMSHEIRTPMNAIIGFSELLHIDNKDEVKRTEYISYIQDSGRLLIKIIDDLIDIAKIESGELEVINERFELNKLIDEIFNHYLSILKLSGNNIKLKLFKDSGKPQYLFSDPLRIRQIFINLINNAIKFTKEGYVEIGYRIENSAVKFYVEDTGIGIPREKFEIIFEPFRQVDETTTRKYGGTGLGLSISKNLIRLMGGQLGVESVEGQGSVFFFTVPQDDIRYNSSEPEQGNTAFINSPEPNWYGKAVLISEDDHACMLLLHKMLEPTGIKIFSAQNGKDAFEKFIENKDIDIVLMDIQMPVENGFQATEKIRQINRDVPIIAQTASAMPKERKLCMNAGCTDYISKPIKRDELLEKMKKSIDSFRTA